MATTANTRTREIRAELQAWYLRGLLPKLARAARTGAVDGGAVAALDADLRALLGISRERKEAA
jgi:hypothetical protein